MNTNSRSTRDSSNAKGMILPFQPLTMTFHNVNYYVDMPKVGRFVISNSIKYIGTRKISRYIFQ
jgi:hypothetical protein